MTDFAAHTARILHRLGRPVMLNPSGGPTRVVNAVFTARPEDALMLSGYAPMLRVCAADADGMEVGDAVQVGDKWFEVAAIEADHLDAGDVQFKLREA